jgi:phage terminase large subunit-like protein
MSTSTFDRRITQLGRDVAAFLPAPPRELSDEAEEMAGNFKVFVKAAWPVLEPATPFVDGWHITAICEHLSSIASGAIKRLLINMPPRHMKSTIVSVMWPVWMWLHDPSIRWLCSSYALSLAIRDNRKSRLLIQSPWYQSLFGSIFQFAGDQNVKSFFENDKRGYRLAVSVGSSATGQGGDALILDDPHNIDEKESDARREAALDWFDHTWSTRLNNPQTGAMVVVSHRIHEKDVSGHILDTNDGEWVHLNLPALFEKDTVCRTPVISRSSDAYAWKGHDPRTEEGELLWEKRFPRAVIEKAKRRHGPLGFAALYMQHPTPAGGLIYKESDRRFFTIDAITGSYLLETPRGRVTVAIADCWNLGVIDLATSTRTSADFFVFETWAVTPYHDALLLHCVHDHLEFPEQQSTISTEFQRFGHAVIAIEKVGYQLAMIQDCVSKGLPIKPFTPQSDKVMRSTTGSIFYSNGKAYHFKDLLNLHEVEKELFTFPKAPHDDIADCHAMMALVVPMVMRPGVLDLDDDAEPLDPTLSIEQLLVAEAMNEAQKEQAAQEKLKAEQELFNRGPQIDVFEWAAEHELDGGWL